MRFAMILSNRAHWIFEQDIIPDFPPDPDGNPMVVIDITDNPEVQEGWIFDPKSETFSEPEYIPPVEGPGDGSSKDISSVIMPLLFGAATLAAGSADNARIVASMAAPAADLIDARAWYVGMTTGPGDLVYDPDKRHIYIFTGAEAMTHSNPLFFPGAAGVFYWTIVPEMHEGFRVYPDVTGIIVAVRRDEIWWNQDRTARFSWDAVDNSAAHWPPGAPGVHQWVRIDE